MRVGYRIHNDSSPNRRLPVSRGRRGGQSRFYVCPDAQRKDCATANHESPRPNDDLGANGHGVRRVSRLLLTATAAKKRVTKCGQDLLGAIRAMLVASGSGPPQRRAGAAVDGAVVGGLL
jgi:hypothetical protein